jgi:serine/threonine protein kinase
MAPFDPLIGHQLGNYRLERLLGHGGMAKVYYGWDVKLQRPVAIKVIDERYRQDMTYTERFVREARAVASWHHPNILQIFYAGEDDDLVYFAMEYIRGLDLGKLIKQYLQVNELMPYGDILHVFRAIANALDYAHGKGVIHRDVKPSNVMVSEDDRVVLTDFGLALNVSHGTVGEVFGSPQYIAPEQARNSAQAVPQSDLYSLGVMLYEMLTGSLPFSDPSPAALALMHITADPPPPREINQELSPAVEAFLLKALKKYPQDRYQSGRELVEAFEAALHSEVPPESQPVTLPLPVETGIHETQSPLTFSNVTVAEKIATQVEDLPPTQEVIVKPTETPQVSIPSKITPGLKWGIGCGLLLLTSVLLIVLSMVFAINRLNTQASSPSSSETLPLGAIALPQSTPTHPPSPAPPVLPAFTEGPTRTPQPSETATQSPEDTPTQTATPTETETPTPTQTETPTPTETQTPTSTPPINFEIELFLAKNKDDSLFIVNKGDDDLPMAPLLLENGLGMVSGEEWKIENLKTGECVALWKDTGKPKAPKDVDCKEVGEKLKRSGSDRFWTLTFKVHYNEVYLGQCVSYNEQCLIEYDND